MIYGPRMFKTGMQAAKQVYENSGNANKPFLSRIWKVADTMPPPQRMSREEAVKVLNLAKRYDKSDVQKQHDMLLELNDPRRGGSFYFQCKIIGAKKVLLDEKDA